MRLHGFKTHIRFVLMCCQLMDSYTSSDLDNHFHSEKRFMDGVLSLEFLSGSIHGRFQGPFYHCLELKVKLRIANLGGVVGVIFMN